MNPHQRNKVDTKNMTSDERAALLYGKAPKPNEFLSRKINDRKYFDSGDYALSKAGKSDDIGVSQTGLQHPSPENIPHSSLATSPQNANPGSITGPKLSPPIGGQSGSPVKESSFLHKEESIDDQPGEQGVSAQELAKHGKTAAGTQAASATDPQQQRDGIAIRPH